MKIHKSTRLLALFLSALMVVASFPLAAFAQSANVSQLKSAINTYETKMQQNNSNGKILTNLSRAYEEYLNAKKLYDSVYYGDITTAQSTIDNAAKTLSDETNKMTVYAPQVTANAKAKWTGGPHDNDSDDIQLAAEFSNKLLYANNFKYNRRENKTDDNVDLVNYPSLRIYKEVDNGHVAVFLQSGDAVMLYDGTKDYPRIPIWSIVCRWATSTSAPEIWGIWPGTSSGDDSRFRVNKPFRKDAAAQNAKEEMCGWVGGEPDIHWYQDNFDNKANKFISGDHACTVTNKYLNTNLADGQGRLGLWNDSSAQVFRYLASTLQYIGTPSAYAENINISWAIYGKSGVYFNAEAVDNIHNTGVLNWKKIQELAKKASGYAQLTFPQNYMQNSASIKSLYSAVDSVTSFDPNNYDYSNVGNAMANINKTMNTADNNINANAQSDNYQTLRNQIDAVRATYEAGNTNYTTSSWDAFKTAYEAAQSFFPANNTYNRASETATTATALNNAKAALDPLANFTDLDNAISKIKAIADNKYTAQSVNEAKTAYEKALADYKMENASKTETGTLNNDNQTKINNEAAAIEEALKKLVEYKDSTYEAIKDAQKAAVDNTDMFDVAKLNEILEGLNIDDCTSNVAFTGKENAVVAYDADAYNRAILNALSESTYKYTVKVDGSDEPIVYDGRTEFTYGETVKVGEAEYNSKVKPGRTATWMEPVYIGSTDKIVVRGDTVLTKCTGEGENVKVVKFVSGGQVYDIQSTTADKFDLRQANIYAPSHYTVSGYKVGDETYDVNGQLPLNETGTTEVTVLFKADTKLGEVTVNNEKHTFGEKVTLNSKDGSEVGFYAANGDHLWNGTSYTFYARETVTIEEGKTLDIVGAHTSRIEPSNGKVYFYGGISNADESNVLSQGMIIELDGEETKDLTLAAVDGVTIFNVTAQRIDSVTKQYSISMPENAASKVRCRAYVAYKTTEDGKEVINYVYSNATQVYPAPSNEVTA